MSGPEFLGLVVLVFVTFPITFTIIVAAGYLMFLTMILVGYAWMISLTILFVACQSTLRFLKTLWRKRARRNDVPE